MPKTDHIELGDRRQAIRIPILYEDRSVIAIDKPAGWMLVPFNWQRTPWNLQAAITSSIQGGSFWAKSRNLKFLKNVHRLDAETTGILLFAKSPGAVDTFSRLFETRRMEKRYLAVVRGAPKAPQWTCEARLTPHPSDHGRVMVDPDHGKESLTAFRVLDTRGDRSLIEAKPLTGRTHQIRVHLREARHPIVGDPVYGACGGQTRNARGAGLPAFPMGLRAVELSYMDPFRRKAVRIEAPTEGFLSAFGFGPRSAC